MAKVYIIDDDEQVRETVRVILENSDCIVREFSDGNRAMEVYERDPADLVIVDIHMPEKNGIEIIQEIQEINPDAKVIVISGGGTILFKDELHMLRALESVKATFEKPLNAKKLLQAVHDLLSESK